MTDGNSVKHLSVVMTTETADDVIQTTGTNAVRSSSTTRVIQVYFQCAVIVIGVVGTAANALILYAMLASKQHKKHLLIFHQNVLDFISCLLLVIISSLKVAYFYSSGSGGYWFCVLVESEYVNWVVILASKINLIFVTIERYLKVVYSVWSKNKLRNWMIFLAMAFAWISGFVHMTATTFTTTKVISGRCLMFVFWKSKASLFASRIFYFFYFYVVILIIFIMCYWRILVVIRRQARVMDSHGSSSGQAQWQQIQTNVVKTMILVSAFFAISDLPINVYFMASLTGIRSAVTNVVYYASVFTSCFYICANPFIYATNFDPVKRVLLGLIPCKKTSVEPAQGVDLDSVHTATKRKGQARN